MNSTLLHCLFEFRPFGLGIKLKYYWMKLRFQYYNGENGTG